MRYFFAIITCSLLIVGAALYATPTYAAPSSFDTEITEAKGGLKNSLKLFTPVATQAGFPEGAAPPEVVVGQIIRALTGVIGVIFGILVVYAGFLWLTDRGKEEQVKKAKGILETAIIGLLITVGAYAITTFVVDRVINASLKGQSIPAQRTSPTSSTADPCENVTCTGGAVCVAGECYDGTPIDIDSPTAD